MGKSLTGLALLLLLSACRAAEPSHPAGILHPRQQSFVHEIQAEGELEPIVQEMLTVPERMWGTLESLLPEGESVAAGAVVAKVNSRLFLERLNRYTERAVEERANLMKQRAEMPLERLKIQSTIQDKERTARLQQLEKTLVEEGERLDARVRLQIEEEIAALRRDNYPLAQKEDLHARGYLSEQELLAARQEALGYETRQQTAALSRQQQSRAYRQPEIEAAGLKATSATLEKRIAELDGQARQSLLRTQTRNQGSRVKGYERRFSSMQARMNGAELKAPFAGTVLYPRIGGARVPAVGMEVWNGMPVALIVKTDALRVRARVDEFRIPHLRAGQQVRLSSPGLPGQSFQGKISKIEKLAKYKDENKPSGLKYFDIEISLERLPPGLKAHMRLELAIEIKRLPQAWVVPLEVLQEKDGKSWLNLRQNGKSVRREVQVLARNDELAALAGSWQGQEELLPGDAP